MREKRFMKSITAFIALLLLFAAGCRNGSADEAEKIDKASDVIEDMMDIPDKTVPEYLFREAYGIAVIPDVLKVGFFVGGRHGQGVMAVRRDGGEWGNPFFITISGGSVGWQMGVQRVDIILVFKSDKSVEAVLGGEFTLGADAAIAVGPVGRQAEASTDVQLEAEIFSYARSRGFFAGLTIEGSVIRIDDEANQAYYGEQDADRITSGDGIRVPNNARDFLEDLTRYAESIDAGND
jgi:lipid-binding SYLF domain-containing protein